MHSRLILLFAVLPVAVLGLLAACTSNDDEIKSLNSRVDQLQQALTKAQAVSTLNALSATGFHELNIEIQAASEIPADDLAKIRAARQVMTAAVWPAELQDKAKALLTGLQHFEAALDANDLAASKQTSTEAHDAWHNLQHDAYRWVAGESMQMGMPSASATMPATQMATPSASATAAASPMASMTSR